MSLTRKVKRLNNKMCKGRTTCPKCHEKLVYKGGYGYVCARCGWWKNLIDKIKEQNNDGENF